MVTIYDLLEVNEKASKEEIEKSYQKLVLEYQTNPVLTEEENKKNELILNKLKIAFEILMNDEKRQKYDRDLSKKRAEELIKNIPVKNNEDNKKQDSKTEDTTIPSNSNNISKMKIESNVTHANISNKIEEERKHPQKNAANDYDEIPKVKNTRDKSSSQEEEPLLSKEEQKKIRKAAQKEFNENLRKVKKAEEEYNSAYNEAYRKYMKKLGYDTNEHNTLMKIRNILIVVIAVIIVCLIAWIIPPVRKILINIYEDNIIIKYFVDIIGALLKSIASIFE